MAQSKLAKATTEATGKKVTDEAIFANALRASGNEDNMPNYHAGDNFAPYGQNFFLPLHTQSEDNKRKELIARLNKDIAYIISNTSY